MHLRQVCHLTQLIPFAFPSGVFLGVSDEAGHSSAIRQRNDITRGRGRADIFIAVHESGHGPSRHFAAAQQLGRIWSEDGVIGRQLVDS